MVQPSAMFDVRLRQQHPAYRDRRSGGPRRGVARSDRQGRGGRAEAPGAAAGSIDRGPGWRRGFAAAAGRRVICPQSAAHRRNYLCRAAPLKKRVESPDRTTNTTTLQDAMSANVCSFGTGRGSSGYKEPRSVRILRMFVWRSRVFVFPSALIIKAPLRTPSSARYFVGHLKRHLNGCDDKFRLETVGIIFGMRAPKGCAQIANNLKHLRNSVSLAVHSRSKPTATHWNATIADSRVRSAVVRTLRLTKLNSSPAQLRLRIPPPHCRADLGNCGWPAGQASRRPRAAERALPLVWSAGVELLH
jgi:hypothetical protein